MFPIFSDLKGFEKETLYIIGNGFDLYHGIPTSYKDFYCWLNCHGHKDFVKKMETTFPKIEGDTNLLWKDFETALGEYDEEEIYNKLTEKRDQNWDDAIPKDVEQEMNMLVSQVYSLLKEWVKYIDIEEVGSLLKLPKESQYFTFNYTMTLERVYGIPPENILHIHNSIGNGDKLIVGHANEQRKEMDEPNFYKEKGKENIILQMNRLAKHVSQIKMKHIDYFKSLVGIKRIVVLGHSYSEIDIQYFGAINEIARDAHWHFSKHSINDEEKLNGLICALEIDAKNRWIFNF
ncbi:MAG: bacteriophage abortive infection AbiH family protein [Prevotella sp.]|nr:bacteriophage abortive infection AbiH family protein [Prevotella sp.]MBQ3624164.1 bacteriophage abortive infection AbiH family protein [Prevotella sp.]